MKGLCNLGNTCYFNSALQCLLQVSPLSNYFLIIGYQGSCEFTQEYEKLVKFMWDGLKSPPAVPRKLLELARQNYKQFAGFDQQDSQEVFICILELLEKSLGTVIKDIFYGKMCQETVYKGGKSIQEEEFCTLIMYPIGDQTIEELLKEYQKWNAIEGYQDDQGTIHNVSATRVTLKSFPRILVLSFKMYDSKKRITISETLEIDNVKYNLFSLCSHQGSTHRGHYVSHTKHQETWYYKDDDHVTETKPETSSYYYIVLYEKSLEL